MKSLIITPLFLMLFSAMLGCKKTSTVMLNEKADTIAMVKAQGSFMGLGSEKVTGQAKIYFQKNKYFLALENFSTTNGPDLKVYLSQRAEPYNFIKLGDLKSTNGYQLYDIIEMPDLSKYRYVLIHCERYNHLFGSAELK